MTDLQDLPGRVAALELLVEQLILERIQTTESPEEAVRLAMGGMSQLVRERPETPVGAVGAITDVLARVMKRLGEG